MPFLKTGGVIGKYLAIFSKKLRHLSFGIDINVQKENGDQIKEKLSQY
jgi:hypothetical protein